MEICIKSTCSGGGLIKRKNIVDVYEAQLKWL